MKRIASILLSVALLLTLTSVASAQEIEKSAVTLTDLKSTLDERVKQLNNEYLSIHLNYTGEEREKKIDLFLESEDVVSLRNEYKSAVIGNPKLEGYYIKSIESYDSSILGEKIQGSLSASLSYESDEKVVDEQIIEMEDGSFAVVSSYFEENSSSYSKLPNMIVAGSATTNVSQYLGYDDYSHTHKLQLKHILYPDTKLGVTTYFTTNASEPYIEIYNVTDNGSFNQLPFVTVVSDIKIARATQEGTKPAKSTGSFTVTYGGYNGVGVHNEKYDADIDFSYSNRKDWEIKITSVGSWKW